MDQKRNTSHRSSILGAIFLMATSAIGPGFLTQTAVFTEQLRANFGFIILLSTGLDIIIQGTIWRVITYTGSPASNLLDTWFRNGGKILTGMVVFGGLIFNIGNLGGAGLGFQAIFPEVSVLLGSGLSAILAFLLLFNPSWRPFLDVWTIALGLLFLGILFWGIGQVDIPWRTLAQHTFIPTQFNSLATLTLVGGTVGGYISFVGAHRLIEAGHTGPAAQPLVRRSAITGIALTSLVRFSLYALFLGLMDEDTTRSWQFEENPAGHAFSFLTSHSIFFGLILWSAAITSAVGATYTSMTFLRSYFPSADKPLVIAGFILISWLILYIWGKPASLLILAGSLNSLVLPFGLAGMLWISHKRNIPFPVVFWWVGWGIVLVFLGLFLESYWN